MSGVFRRYTQQQVIDALTEAHGLKGPAAQALKCHRTTVTRYIARYPLVKRAYEEAREATIDLAESKLVALIEREDWRAIRYLLGTLGKDRGYTERQEIVAVGEDPEAVRQRFLEEIRRVYGEEDRDEDEG